MYTTMCSRSTFRKLNVQKLVLFLLQSNLNINLLPIKSSKKHFFERKTGKIVKTKRRKKTKLSFRVFPEVRCRDYSWSIFMVLCLLTARSLLWVSPTTYLLWSTLACCWLVQPSQAVTGICSIMKILVQLLFYNRKDIVCLVHWSVKKESLK